MRLRPKRPEATLVLSDDRAQDATRVNLNLIQRATVQRAPLGPPPRHLTLDGPTRRIRFSRLAA